MRGRFTWTAEEIALLRSAYDRAGTGYLGIDALSAQLGRLKSNVSRKARQLGLATTRHRPAPTSTKAAVSAGTRAWQTVHGHPRGMLGKRHSEETRKRMSENTKAMIQRGHPCLAPSVETRQKMSATMSARLRASTNVYSRCRHGKRDDLGGQYFRSSWEANYARFLNLLIEQGQITSWEYEADTFWFEKIRRGVRSYTPDFRISQQDGSIYYVEVKGWMDAKSRTKLKRMKKYHPTIDLRLVDQKAYNEIDRKLGGAIPNWEKAA